MNVQKHSLAIISLLQLVAASKESDVFPLLERKNLFDDQSKVLMGYHIQDLEFSEKESEISTRRRRRRARKYSYTMDSNKHNAGIVEPRKSLKKIGSSKGSYSQSGNEIPDNWAISTPLFMNSNSLPSVMTSKTTLSSSISSSDEIDDATFYGGVSSKSSSHYSSRKGKGNGKGGYSETESADEGDIIFWYSQDMRIIFDEIPVLFPTRPIFEPPSTGPTVSQNPSQSPSVSSSPSVSAQPTNLPSKSPSMSPSVSVMPSLSVIPSLEPTDSRMPSVSETPSLIPSSIPSSKPSIDSANSQVLPAEGANMDSRNWLRTNWGG